MYQINCYALNSMALGKLMNRILELFGRLLNQLAHHKIWIIFFMYLLKVQLKLHVILSLR